MFKKIKKETDHRTLPRSTPSIVAFYALPNGRTRIRVHYRLMQEAGFKVGDTIDLLFDRNTNEFKVVAGDTHVIRKQSGDILGYGVINVLLMAQITGKQPIVKVGRKQLRFKAP